MPKSSVDKLKLQQLARWLIPQYVDSKETKPRELAIGFGLKLIDKLPIRDLSTLVNRMQYVLASIEETTE